MIIIAVILSLFSIVYGLDCRTYEDAYRKVDDFLDEDQDILPTMVRLAFHDCVGESCNGCINLKDNHNAGLAEVVEKLDDLYDPYSYYMSRADFWQLAAQVALVRAGLNGKCDSYHKCSYLDLQFRYGRKDCHTSPIYNGEDDAGSAHGDFGELYRVLHGSFGLTAEEVVTAIGAHSLGGAHDTASGFHYNWQSTPRVFDNQFYKNLCSLSYTHEDVFGKPVDEDEETVEAVEAASFESLSSRDVDYFLHEFEKKEYDEEGESDKPHRYQFARVPTKKGEVDLLLLNTDMSLLKNLKATRDHHGDFTGKLKCLTHEGYYRTVEDGDANFLEKCKNAPTAPLVYKYANDLDLFYHDFSKVWDKITSNGASLKKPAHGKCGSCIPDGAYCVEGFDNSAACCPGSHCIKNRCI